MLDRNKILSLTSDYRRLVLARWNGKPPDAELPRPNETLDLLDGHKAASLTLYMLDQATSMVQKGDLPAARVALTGAEVLLLDRSYLTVGQLQVFHECDACLWFTPEGLAAEEQAPASREPGFHQDDSQLDRHRQGVGADDASGGP